MVESCNEAFDARRDLNSLSTLVPNRVSLILSEAHSLR
jgi:hypothetical protein